MTKLFGLFDSWSKAATAILGFLVVLPSIINAITDIYVAWQGLPIGNQEKINAQLFQRHFQEDPLNSQQLVVQAEEGVSAMTVDIFRNGDVFINYGLNVQWFPYKDVQIASRTFQFMNSAQASWYVEPTAQQPPKILDAESVKIESRYISKTEIERTRYLSDGSKIIQVINVNTGQIISSQYVAAP